MKFLATNIQDLYTVHLDHFDDARGSFARAFCKEEFDSVGLEFNILQSNISYNKTAGTLRGMHYQKSPFQEAKLVRCTRGSIFDVAVDLRKSSKTYKKWYGLELNDKNRTGLFIPKDFAHGFITLEDETEVLYLMNEVYNPDSGAAFRWDDRKFSINWPIEPIIMSSKDRAWDDFLG
jgi:dTDP-4-dehydrorhamnose 3,5-epimerase